MALRCRRCGGKAARVFSFLFCLQIFFTAAHCFGAIPTLRYEVVARYAHPEPAFTQGFELDNGIVYESSGLYGRSYLATWQLEQTRKHKEALPTAVFGEGLTVFGNRIYLVTWREQRGFIFDKATLQKLGEFSYSGEGWGLTHDGHHLIMSDGSATLRFIDPQSQRTEKNLAVTEDGAPVELLNELEWIPAQGNRPARLLANIWQRDEIVAIDPESGHVTARLDLSHLYPKSSRAANADVLNGIAFDNTDHTLLITGKLWPFVYRLKLLDAPP